MIGKLGLTIGLVAIAAAVIWIEHGHRTDIEMSRHALATSVGGVCPSNENDPYTADCISFMQGTGSSEDRRQSRSAEGVPADVNSSADMGINLTCPSSDSVPYSPNCIRYLSGRIWHSN